MEVRYEDRDLERTCADERTMFKKRADVADKLRLRVNALRIASKVGDLRSLDPLGDWHPLTSNRAGTWAGKLSRNQRLVIRPDGEGAAADAVTVTVIEIFDYH
ncbi:Plasmid maintenance system killer protein [Plantibacter sp. T3]|nr:Plasmid maintenance system killer protein [Plantibacter sp. T3]